VSGKAIEVPDAPRIPGLVFREFAGPSDYPGMVEVLNEVSEADALKWCWTSELIANMDASIQWADPKKDRVIVEVNRVMVGVGRMQGERNISGERVYFASGNIRPGWRRKGIGRALLRHGERRLREIAAEQPNDGPRYFMSYPVAATQVGNVALLRNSGYQVIRYSNDMVRPGLEQIPDSRLPEGIEIRPVREEDLRKIWEAKEEAFHDLWGFIPMGDQAFAAWCGDPTWRKDISSVAWAGSDVVGMVLGLVSEEENRKNNRRRVYTESICVRRPWRKRGVARALIAHCLRLARGADFTEAGLSVDAQSPSGALGLYESLGYRVTDQFMFFRKPMD
jgi:ribosomal protein S18 acetylase RimI-like enzyme